MARLSPSPWFAPALMARLRLSGMEAGHIFGADRPPGRQFRSAPMSMASLLSRLAGEASIPALEHDAFQ